MTTFELNTVVFAVALIIFFTIAVRASRHVISPKSFFHNESITPNIISLTVANITLGTGVAYILVGAQNNGLLMLLVAVMPLIGYYLLASFLKKLNPAVLAKKNFFTGIDNLIYEQTHSSSHFGSSVIVSLIFIYVLALSFEIFASSKIIAPLLFVDAGLSQQILLSIIVFIIALLYTILGGINAVFRTDKVQLGAILVFVPMLFYVAVIYPLREGSSLPTIDTILKLDKTVIFAIATASIMAIATQFFSLMNWGYISTVRSGNRERLLKKVALFSFLVILVITITGVLHPSTAGSDALTDLMSSYSRIGGVQCGLWAYILLGFSVLGMCSIIFSTVDSLMIKIIMFFYDNVAKRDSKKEDIDPIEVKRIRTIVFICFLIVFLVLAYMNYTQPNIFYLLLTLAGGAVVFAPMVVTAGYLSTNGNAIKAFNNKVVLGYIALFIVTFMVSVLALNLKPHIVGYIGFFAFLTSSFGSIIIILTSKQKNS